MLNLKKDNIELDFFLIDHTAIGGVERVTSSLMRLFLANNIKIRNVISLWASNNRAYFEFPDNINYIVLNTAKKNVENQIYRQFLALNTKIIIFQGDNMTISIAILKAAKKANVIAIPMYHGSPYAYLNKYISLNDILYNPINGIKLLISSLQRPFKKQKLKKFLQLSENGVVCVSNGVKNELIDIFPLLKNKIFSINNPLSYPIKKTDNDLFAKENHIVYVSRLEKKHKNSFLIMKAWLLIHKIYPKWELHILGDGSLRSKMENYADVNQIKNVIFHGFEKDVSRYLKFSKISLLSSNCEGLGMGLLESISYKNAIVSTKSDGGVTDLVKHAQTGLLVPKNDHIAFSKAIEILMNDDELRTNYATNGFKLLDDFSDDLIITKWVEVLKNK